MIFYFSGTGNSKHVADKISGHTSERLVYISENTIAEKETYEIGENESIGFVFPVYWLCMPTIFEKFIVQLKLSGYQKQYVYAVVTYGVVTGNVMDRLTECLNKKNIILNGRFGVKMVDNYVIGKDMISSEEQRSILAHAELEIDKIITMIEHHDGIEYLEKGAKAFLTPITGYAYRKTDHTRKFFTTQKCNGCKQCEIGCPCNVIHIVDHKPVWEGECTFCLKCINSCKQSAIQYGKSTEKRDRYQYKNAR
jgi:ferredoxin